jgi:hypothetical protein
MSLVSPVQSRGIQQFFQSPKWKIHHWADNLLHRAAVASLDRTVASLGADSVQQQVTELRALRQTVEATCGNETMYPCSATGTPQLDKASRNCYIRDFGCGHACIDRVIAATAAAAELRETDSVADSVSR